jgi:hypothetical protein
VSNQRHRVRDSHLPLRPNGHLGYSNASYPRKGIEMKLNRLHLPALLLVLTAVAACAEDPGMDNADDIASEESAATFGSNLSLGPVANGCNPGVGLSLQFRGVDAAGRETYSVEGIRASNIGRPSACDINQSLIITPGHKARIRGISIFGNIFRSPGAFGSFDVFHNLRTARAYVTSTSVPQPSSPGFSRVDFSMGANDFTNCARLGDPPTTLLIRPGVTVNGGTPGQPASINVDINSLTESIEIVACTP